MKKNKGDFIIRWTNCKLDYDDEDYEECRHCKNYSDCLTEAEDSRDGYSAFEDLILGSGYDSMDEFWDSNI